MPWQGSEGGVQGGDADGGVPLQLDRPQDAGAHLPTYAAHRFRALPR